MGIYGYDLIAYRKFIEENPVEVQGIVKLGEVFENPAEALLDPQDEVLAGWAGDPRAGRAHRDAHRRQGGGASTRTARCMCSSPRT